MILTKTGEKCRAMCEGINKLMDKAMGKAFDMSSTQRMEVEEFILYKDLMKSYDELMDVCVDVCKQLDEQSEALDSLQKDMKKLLEGKA
jgi:hypothetical protein